MKVRKFRLRRENKSKFAGSYSWVLQLQIRVFFVWVTIAEFKRGLSYPDKERELAENILIELIKRNAIKYW